MHSSAADSYWLAVVRVRSYSRVACREAGWADGGTGMHTAVVTGANHGIGAATALALGQRGCAVLCAFLRMNDPPDPGPPQAYREHRRHDARPVAAQIRAAGGRAIAVEADLSDLASPAKLFDAAESQLGPVDILVNNATGWVADTFTPSHADRLSRSHRVACARLDGS